VTRQQFFSKVETRLRALNRADSTINLYSSALKQFVNFCGDKDLTKIDTTDFEKFTSNVLKRKPKPGTLRTLKYGINFGFNEVLNNSIDVSAMPTPNSPRLKPEYFEKKELLFFFSKIHNLKHKAIMELMYSAGLDIADIPYIKVTDIKSEKKHS
jgi:integrase/recombinase XerD